MQHACLTSLVLAGLLCCKKAAAACKKRFQNKTVSTNFFSLKGGEFDLFEFAMLFHKHLCSLASSCQIPKTSKTLSKTFGNFQKRKCSPVEENILLRLLGKRHAHGVEKRRQTSPQNVRTKKLIPNSFAVQIASSANEFHRKTKFFSKKLMSNTIIQK